MIKDTLNFSLTRVGGQCYDEAASMATRAVLTYLIKKDVLDITHELISYIKICGSESHPRKVELTHFSTTESILYITTKLVFVLTKTSHMAVIFIS